VIRDLRTTAAWLATLLLLFAITMPTAAQEEGYAVIITEKVAASDSYTYAFSAAAGDVITVTVASTEITFDPMLNVYMEDGTILAANDNHRPPDPALNPPDARLQQLELPETGEYVISVTGLNAIGGSFEMQIVWLRDQLFPQRQVPAPIAQFSAPLWSETTTVQIKPDDHAYYSFQGQRGDVFEISARTISGDLDVNMALYLRDSLLLIANDDHGSSDPTMALHDARIANVITPEPDGWWYLLELHGYPGTGGAVEITNILIARGGPLYPGLDQGFEGDITPNEIEAFTFEAAVGDYVTITGRALDPLLDPTISLFDAAGALLYDNDNHGFNDADLDFFDSRILNYLIRESGTYTVAIGSARGGAGRFTLTVNIKPTPTR